MKKILIASVIALVMLGTLVIAQTITPKIKIIGVLGRGIAVSTADPTSFKIVKAGIATVRVVIMDEETELKVGVLFLDGDKYVLKDIQIGNETVSGNIYSNDTQVGSFNLSLVIRGEHEIWFGSLSVSGQNYNVYVLEGKRPVKPEEVGEKIEDLCEKFPEKCTAIGKGVGGYPCEKEIDKSCREKIREYCEDHPNDARCVSVFREYCRSHLDDARCREGLMGYCKYNPTAKQCEEFCGKHLNVCGVTTTTILPINITTTTTTVPINVTTTTTNVTTTTLETTTTTTNYTTLCRFTNFIIYNCFYNSSTSKLTLTLNNIQTVEVKDLMVYLYFSNGTLSSRTKLNETLVAGEFRSYILSDIPSDFSKIVVTTQLCPDISKESVCTRS